MRLLTNQLLESVMAYFDHTAQRVRELLNYDPATGILTRRVGAATTKVGDVADTLNQDGYVYLKLGRRGFFGHRVAWLHFYGAWPISKIDHMNGIRTDNRIANLREVTDLENVQNQRLTGRNSKSGMLGIHWRKDSKKWRVRISVAGKKVLLGSFGTIEEAAAVHLEAKRRMHAGFLG